MNASDFVDYSVICRYTVSLSFGWMYTNKKKKKIIQFWGFLSRKICFTTHISPDNKTTSVVRELDSSAVDREVDSWSGKTKY